MSCRIWSGSLTTFLLAGSLLLYLPWQMVLFVFAAGGIILGLAAYKHWIRASYSLESSLMCSPKLIDFAAVKANQKGKLYQFPVINQKASNQE